MWFKPRYYNWMLFSGWSLIPPCRNIKVKKNIKTLENCFYMYDFLHFKLILISVMHIVWTDTLNSLSLMLLFHSLLCSHLGSLVSVLSRQHMRWLWDFGGRKPFWIGKYLQCTEEGGETQRDRLSSMDQMTVVFQ